LVEFISSATGGPLKYEGKSMKEAHKGMKITNDEFDAAAKDLKEALEKHGAKAGDVEAVMTAVSGTRKDIVEGKEPDEKKPDEKKPEEKPADKGSVSGKVSYKGKPVTGGLIVFTGADGKEVKFDVSADGTYMTKELKAGEYMVAVDTENLNKDQEKPNPAYVKIPAKFRDAKTSSLKIEVRKGEQTQDLDLQD
jgi:hypothetical protein